MIPNIFSSLMQHFPSAIMRIMSPLNAPQGEKEQKEKVVLLSLPCQRELGCEEETREKKQI